MAGFDWSSIFGGNDPDDLSNGNATVDNEESINDQDVGMFNVTEESINDSGVNKTLTDAVTENIDAIRDTIVRITNETIIGQEDAGGNGTEPRTAGGIHGQVRKFLRNFSI